MLDFLWSILAFIVAISILVAVHEYGHFWVARKLDFKVLRFSIGFGKPLLRWRSGDTDNVEYCISAIPLGGYVKMLDEREGDVPPEETHRAFNQRPVWARIAVLAAGPGANFIFAIAAYWLMFTTGVEDITPYVGEVREDTVAAEAGLRADDVIAAVDGLPTPTLDQALVALFDELLSDGVIELTVEGEDGSSRNLELDVRGRVNELTEPDALFDGLGIVLGPQPPEDYEPIVGAMVAGDPAERAGLQVGDRIVALDGQSIGSWRQLQTYVSSRPGDSIELSIMRDGDRQSLSVTPAERLDAEGIAVGRIGIEPPNYITEEIADRFFTVRRYGVVSGVGVAVTETWQRTALSFRFIWRMVTGDVSLENMSGPVMIAAYAGDFAQAGFNRFLQFLAMISISLGIVNLLPVPILDGGQIVVAAIEGIKGKPLSMRAAVIGQQVGLAMLIALMGFVFYNDISRLLGS